MPLNENDVREAYRMILGRDPENDNVIQSHLAAVSTLNELRARFIGSDEFQKNAFAFNNRNAAKVQYAMQHDVVETECDADKLQKLFDHIASVWSMLGEVRPHFSVLSDVKFKPDRLDQTIGEFELSGHREAEGLQLHLKGLGLPTSGYRNGVELGCGVGRVTKHLPMIVDNVVGYDVSMAHIALAEEYIAKSATVAVSFSHIPDPAAYSPAGYDFFYSRIVLQHNPPPIIAYFLRRTLENLAPGGVAVFQIPTSMENYRFVVDEYIDEMATLYDQELHPLPIKTALGIIIETGCKPHALFRDDSVSGRGTVSTHFTVRKDG